LLSFFPQRKPTKELSRAVQILSRYQCEMPVSRNTPNYVRYRPVVLHVAEPPELRLRFSAWERHEDNTRSFRVPP